LSGALRPAGLQFYTADDMIPAVPGVYLLVIRPIFISGCLGRADRVAATYAYDEARRIAANIVKLPDQLRPK